MPHFQLHVMDSSIGIVTEITRDDGDFQLHVMDSMGAGSVLSCA